LGQVVPIVKSKLEMPKGRMDWGLTLHLFEKQSLALLVCARAICANRRAFSFGVWVFQQFLQALLRQKLALFRPVSGRTCFGGGASKTLIQHEVAIILVVPVQLHIGQVESEMPKIRHVW
jgi:hypothetical protein